MRKLLNILQTLLVILLAAALTLNVLALARDRGANPPMMMNYAWAVVLSGSMEPAISVDDLVIAHAQADYAVGDIIMYRHGSALITHRITEQTEDGYITQGDANNTPDQQTVVGSEIVGKIICAIPHVGLVIGYLKTPMGMCGAAMLAALIILLPGLLRRESENDDTTEE